MSEHTKEPWYLGESGMERGKICVKMPDGGPYVVADTNWNFPDQAKQDARRIVACVNACAGIETEELEAGKYSGLLRAIQDKKALEQDRDRLREALEDVVACVDAAQIEGLSTVLAETLDERLKDLVERRLLWAKTYAERAIIAEAGKVG